MKLKLSLALVLLCAIFTTSAQSFKVKWGPEYKKEGGLFSIDYLLGNDGKHFYALSSPLGNAKLQKYDYNCKLISSTPFELETGKGKASISDMIRLGAKTFILLTSRDKKADIENYYYTEMKNGSFNKTIKNFYALPFEFDLVGGSFKKSPKGNYMAVLVNSRGKNKEEVMKAIVFDDNLKLVWEKTIPLKIKDKNISLETYIVDNNGDMFLSARHFDSDEAYKKGLPKFKYIVYRITPTEFINTVIDLGDGTAPWDAGLFPSNGGVYIGGFYTKTSTPRGSADGVFVSEVTNGKAKSNSYPFTEEFLEGLQTKKQDKKDEGISRFNIDYLVLLADGSLSFIAEKYYITTHTVSNGKTTTTYYVYHSEEIVVPRFNSDGKLIVMEKVDKVFSSRSPIIVSYSYFVKDNNIALVYNDFKTRDERKSSGKGRAIYTDISYLSGTGKVKTENIFTSKDVDKYYIPSASMDLGNGSHVIKAIRGKTYVYGIITP